MAAKINILFLIDYLHDSGGTETHLAYLATRLNRDKFNCHIATFSLGEGMIVANLRQAGLHLAHIPVGRYYTWNAWRQALLLAHFIKKHQIDIVQTFHIKSDCYGAVVAKLAGVRTIVSSKRDIGDLKSKWHFFLNRLVRRLVDRYIVVADAVGEVVVAKEKVAREKIVTIYNGVDLHRFQPPTPTARREARARLGFHENDFVVGTVAWLRPEKNYPIFFHALSLIKEQIKELKVVVVGGGDKDKEYRQEAAARGLTAQVTFAGHRQDVRPLLQTFDVACLVPGRNEGFSNAILEKMAMGLPLVVTEVGGNAEAVLHEHNGLIIPPDDAESLADSLLALYRAPTRRLAMGICSRQRTEEKFSLTTMLSQHESLYLALQEKRPPEQRTSGTTRENPARP